MTDGGAENCELEIARRIEQLQKKWSVRDEVLVDILDRQAQDYAIRAGVKRELWPERR